ncbi:GMP synthase, partial [Clarias magur]
MIPSCMKFGRLKDKQQQPSFQLNRGVIHIEGTAEALGSSYRLTTIHAVIGPCGILSFVSSRCKLERFFLKFCRRYHDWEM